MTSASELRPALEAALAQATGSRVEIKVLTLMPGGASQEMWRLDLTVGEGAWQGDYPLVMRRQVGSKIYADALDPGGEFRVLQAAYESGVPVPRPYWLLDDLLGRIALVMRRLEGETIGRRVVKEPGLAEARKRLPRQMGTALAAIHRIDPDKHNLRGTVPAPAQGQTPAQVSISRGEADLDRIGEPHPALELCLRWLRRHEPPPPERLVLVHGDFRIGNMVVTPQGLGGVLDWEFAHIGDPAEDLAWGLVRDWRFGADHLHYGGVGESEDFFAAYDEQGGGAPRDTRSLAPWPAASGGVRQGGLAFAPCSSRGFALARAGSVDRERIFYWEVMGNVRWAVGTLNQAQRHLRGEEPNLELASLGRRCAEMELEALRLIKHARPT